MFRALLYGSYKPPRELLWLLGMLVYLALMAEAFMGYVLPWGNMSFWGAQVIVNLFGTIPGDRAAARGVDPRRLRYRGCDAEPVLRAARRGDSAGAAAAGDAAPGGLAPTGSNNPDGIEIKDKLGPDGKPLDGIPFHPYYTVKDVVGVGVFFVLFAIIVFFVPTFGGLFLEGPNFEPANPMSTPGAHRAGVVLHAVLRDPARRAGSARWARC